jgi:tetratricopeptide (TPR) repeat protein
MTDKRQRISVRKARARAADKGGPTAPRESSGGGREARVNWTFILLVLVAGGLVCYWNSLATPFVLDDIPRIVDNPRIRHLWPLWDVLTYGGRPILYLSVALNYAYGSLDPRGYHVANLAIHIIAGLALFGILRRALESRVLADRFGKTSHWLAMAMALIWMVHPLQTESVTYVIQRGESLMGMCYLLTLYCAIRYAEAPDSPAWGAAAVAVCAAGMATKEVMVTAPLMVLLYDRIFIAPSFAEIRQRRWKLYAGLFATLVILAALLATGPSQTGFETGVEKITPWEYATTQSKVLVHYLRLVVWPSPLVLDYWWPVVRGGIGSVWPYALGIAALVVMTGWALLRWKPVGFLGAWFFLILAPTSSVLPIADVAFEHRLYLPLAAMVTLFVLGGYEALRIAQRRFGWKDAVRNRLAIVAVVICTTGLSLATIRRNQDYRTHLSIYSDTAAKRPNNPRARYNLGVALDVQGKLDEALAQYAEAVRLRPSYAEAQSNLGLALYKKGRLNEAVEHFSEAIRYRPDLAVTHRQFGAALKKLGRTEEAMTQYAEAVRLKPDDADARNDLGALLFDKGRLTEAVAQFSEAVRLKPRYAEANHNLGLSLYSLGRVQEAIPYLAEAVRLKPDYAEAHNTLGAALHHAGRVEEATHHFSEALRIRPDYADARRNLDAARSVAASAPQP